MKALTWLPRRAWRAVRQGWSLLNIWDDTDEIYGDNPNGLPEGSGITRAALANNAAGQMGTGL